MAHKNKDISVKVDSATSGALEADTLASAEFVDNLIDTFKDKGALLEAQRLVEAKDKTAEFDLIFNDEEHSKEYLAYSEYKNIPLE